MAADNTFIVVPIRLKKGYYIKLKVEACYYKGKSNIYLTLYTL